MSKHKSTREFNPKKSHRAAALKFIAEQQNKKTILVQVGPKTWIEKEVESEGEKKG